MVNGKFTAVPENDGGSDARRSMGTVSHVRPPGPDAPIGALARDPGTVREARALRHAVFVTERGAAAGFEAGLEGDAHDADAEHLIVRAPDGAVVATARLGRGWTAREFDLSALTSRGVVPLELGRACVRADHRGGLAGAALFAAALRGARDMGAVALVGSASFSGSDPAPHRPALRALRAAALAPREWRAVAHGPWAISTKGEAPRSAMAGVPPLIKSYLRAGAWIGEGACVDAAFNAVDVCVVLDMARLRIPAAFA